MDVWTILLVFAAVLTVFYILNILKNALVLFLVTTVILFFGSKYIPDHFTFNTKSVLLVNSIIIGGYILLEILNLLFNIFDVISSIMSFLLSPFKKKLKKEGEE